jgi:hypothetical protein
MNKRQSKKKQKIQEEAEWLYFMSGLYPTGYKTIKVLQRWVKKELRKDEKEI